MAGPDPMAAFEDESAAAEVAPPLEYPPIIRDLLSRVREIRAERELTEIAEEGRPLLEQRRFENARRRPTEGAGKIKKMYSAELSPEEVERRKAEEAVKLETHTGQLLRNMEVAQDQMKFQESQGFKTWDEVDTYLERAEALADMRAQLYEDVRQRTLEDFKAGRIDKKTFNERLTKLLGRRNDQGQRNGGMYGEVERLRKQIAEQKAQMAESRLEAETAQAYTEGGKTALSGIAEAADWQPVSWLIEKTQEPQRFLAGLASLGAEHLDVLAPPLALTDYETEEFAKGGTKVGIEDFIPGPLGMGEDNAIVQRGKDFNQKVGRALSAVGFDPIGPVGRAAVPQDWAIGLSLGPVLGHEKVGAKQAFEDLAERIRSESGEGGEFDDALNSLSFELATDPLNLVEGVNVTKGLKTAEAKVLASKPFLRFAAKHPKIAYAPSKTWRYVTGKAKEAFVLGDPGMEQVLFKERVFNNEAGYEYAKLRHDSLQAEARLTNQVGEGQLEQAKESLPALVEKGRDKRMADRAMLEEDDVYTRALLDAADEYEDLGARAYALDQKFSRRYTKLAGEYSWFGRRYSDEYAEWLAENPSAQAILFGEQAGGHRDAVLKALADWEKGRKMRDFDFYESEQLIRDSLRKGGHDLPDDVPIWSREAFGDLAKRAQRAGEQAKMRNMALNFAEEFGVPVNDGGVEAMMKEWSDLEREAIPTEMVQVRAKRLRSAILEEQRRIATDLPEDFTEVEALHGTVRDFEELSTTAERVAIKDKPGRGEVRGVFLTPDPQVAANYIAVNFPEVAKQIGKGKLDLISANQLASDFMLMSQKGMGPEVWAKRMAEFVFGKKKIGLKDRIFALFGKRPLADYQFTRYGLGSQVGKDGVRRLEAKGVTAFKEKGGEAIEFTAESRADLEKLLAGLARDDELYESGLTLVPHVEGAVRPRIIKQKIGGRMVDLTDLKNWDDELIDALNRSKHPDDRRVAWEVEKASRNEGQFDSMNVVERSPALQKWLADKGYDIVKKPEYDPITGDFSYWVLNEDALKGGRKYKKATSDRLRALKREYRKMADTLTEAAKKSPESWSAEEKANWVMARVRHRVGFSKKGPTTALRVLMESKAQLPEDIGELARLANTIIQPEDARKFRKYLENFHWKNLDDPNQFFEGIDAIKRIFQRAVLSRFASVTKDNLGAFTQSLLAGNQRHLAGAIRDLGGNPITWAKGMGKEWAAPDDVIRLMNEGALETTKGEALANPFFKNKLMRGIEERGVVGGLIPKKLGGEAVGKFTDTFMHQRVWFEQVNRLATYRKAIAEGMEHADALEQVYAYWGKFDELTKLERGVFNRIFFFWSWMARSVPITIRSLIEHPVRMRFMLMMMAGDAINEEGELMPEWMRRMGGWVMGRNPDGSMDVMSTGSSTYASPTFSFLQGDMVKAMRHNEWASVVPTGGREFLRSASPLVSQPAEALSTTDYFTNQRWWDEPGEIFWTGTESNMKAPSFMYWLMDPSGENPTALQKLMNLKAETDKDSGEFRRVSMDPRFAWLLDSLPGAAPLMTDISSFVHPALGAEGSGIETRAGELKLSIKSGLSRQAGLPIYHATPPDEPQKDLWELRSALHRDVDRLSSNSLVYRAGQVQPNDKSARGRRLKNDRAKWRDEARDLGLGRAQQRAYVSKRVRENYLKEWRLMELADRLSALQILVKQEKIAAPGDFEGVEPPDLKSLRKQAQREANRRRERVANILKFK